MNDFATIRVPRGRRILALCAVAAAACVGTPGEDGAPVEPLDEVRIGYGSQEREEVTGAVTSVRAEDIGREVTSFEDLFQGMAGVTVRRLSNGGISLRIRGSSSFSSDGEPLYVINGLTIRAAPGLALMGVNPREVTRVDVLKDAGATAIYGSRGANGVVLIFTVREDPRPPL
jgi:TonB-dependent SusC/RagA subfamily outer membrane receptor